MREPKSMKELEERLFGKVGDCENCPQKNVPLKWRVPALVNPDGACFCCDRCNRLRTISHRCQINEGVYYGLLEKQGGVCETCLSVEMEQQYGDKTFMLAPYPKDNPQFLLCQKCVSAVSIIRDARIARRMAELLEGVR